MQESSTINVRQGEKQDIESVFQLVEELAVHHKHDPDYISNTPEQMLNDAFGTKRYFDFMVAEEDGKIVGATIYYFIYSTWKGKSLYLEDLIITESHRGRGIGKLFMQALAEEAVAQGAQKMKWQVADDNHGAIRFYERTAADLDSNWINCELNHSQLSDMVEANEDLVTA
uniref:GNAT family N-acetyltransferase n=1 Tax=Roseihalotalea indica TaxID=2867963 RepID=A0AA49JGN0_9BACT|nr:GNAT family N-acetyltransferase [Tunicatimonas sp. TK19036]